MNNKSNKILILIAFICGALLMYYLLNLRDKTIDNSQTVNKNIVTTTIEEESDLKTAINNIYDSVVYIEVSNNKRAFASGSGFVYKVLDNKAYILTNYHVIEDGTEYTVTFIDGKQVNATLVNGDEFYDIAVLTIDKTDNTKVAQLGSSANLELGDSVFTVGAPLGKDYMGTITKGIVSGVNRMVSVKLSSGEYLMEAIQTDASINTGNSGGPICNIRGEVIGITSSKLIGSGVEGMGFAIPIDSVVSILDTLEKGIKIDRPYLGIQLADLSSLFQLQYYYGIKLSSDITYGAIVSYVEDNKPASKAGLKVGDTIIEMDGEKVEDVSHFRYILFKHKIGDKIEVKYYRGNEISTTTIDLTESIKSE